MEALWTYTARELAGLVAGGEVSSVEVVEAHLERVSAVNPAVNAVTQVWGEGAIAAAQAVDRARSAGDPLGPLAGVPFSVKENIDVAGHPTTHGVPALKQIVPPVDAPIVQRLRAAGGIPLAHTNLPDLSVRFHTESQLYGETRNPWDPALTPGGSSGGEGVALGTGMSPLGLGNDAGGSVRLPALFAGVSALKPTTGRFPSDRSILPRELTLASQVIPVDGVLARSAADLRLALALLAGPDPRDPRAVPAPVEGPPMLRRVGLTVDPGGLGVDAATRAGLERAARALEEAGYAVEPVEIPRLEETLAAYGGLIMTEFGMVKPMFDRVLGPNGLRYIELSMAARPPVELAAYVQLTATRLGLQQAWAALFADYPVILGPVFTMPAPPAGFDVVDAATLAEVANAMRLCTATSFVGVPAVSIPVGLEGALPQGVQLVSSWFREDLALEAALAIEARMPRLAPIDPRG